MSEKVTGYLMIIGGLFLIVLALFSVFSVFTGNTQPATLFDTDGISLDLSKLVNLQVQPEYQQFLSEDNSPSPTEIIPADLLNRVLNLVFHIMFMGFVAAAGGKIAGVGTMLVRAIEVNIKEAEKPPKPLAPPTK